MSDSAERPDSRVREWVHQLATEGNELHAALAENFTYYLDHVADLEDGELDPSDLPELDAPDRAVMHAAVMCGLSWGKDSTVHLVTDADDAFVAAFGIKENAERTVEANNGYSITSTTPLGKDPWDDISAMKDGDSEMLPKTGECLEHLIENQDEFENGNAESVIDGMPHFPQNVKWLIAYSALFGRLWEFSDPALWVVLDEDDTVEGLYADPSLAAYVEQRNPECRATPITPHDNDRHANPHIPTE